MTSLLDRAFADANRGGEPAPDGDPLRERILDAAATQFRLTGIRRSTVDDVARRAGLTRVTVYRRFGNRSALVEELMLRELRGYFAQFAAAVRGADTAQDRLVEGFVVSIRGARRNALVSGMLAVEPEVLVPLLTTEGGPILGTVRDFVAARLHEEQQSGAIPAGADVRLAAEVVARLGLSLFVTPGSLVDLDDPGQIRAFARRALVPLIS